ncbi:MAG: hypothetical protein M1816_000302 [Peltula sp. TS41687]|nr:MAG: hypothetical protein M1816_000302 [Peltula sp. TS41687]
MSCVNIAERLKHQLRRCKSNKIQPTDSAAFSIAMSGTEARLYVSWKHDELNYYMQRIDGFLLYEPEHYLKFRKYVQNIIDWGKDKRLNEIRDSLDCLLEESRHRTSAPKPLQPLSDSSTKPKSLPSCSRSSNARGQSYRANELYQEPNRDQSSYPRQQESLVDTNDCATFRDIDEGPALPSYLYSEDDQQDQTQLLASFDSSAEVPTSFATSFTSSFTSSTCTKRPGASPIPSATSHRSKKHSSTTKYEVQ